MEWWEWVAGWLALPLSVGAVAFAWIAYRRAKRVEVREAETLEIARRAEKRAEEAHSIGRVRFQFDSSEVVEDGAVLAGDVRLQFLHVGTVPVDAVEFDAGELAGWEVSMGGTVQLKVLPGQRADLFLRRNRFGQLPESVTMHWWIGDEQGQQAVPLPAALSRKPEH